MDLLAELLFGTGLIRAVQQFFGLGHTLPFRLMSMLGDTWGILVAVGVGFWLFGRRALYALVGITVFAAGTWLLVSGAFDVSRPEGPGIVVYDHLEFGAFPSGHVTQAAATWGLLYALGLVPLVVPVVAVALTALGRIYLGAHFPGDVLGGMLYGALVVAVFYQLWRRVRGWLEARSVSFYLVVAGLALAAGIAWMTQLPADATERRVEVVALLIAAAVVLPAEDRWLRYSPPELRPWRIAAMTAIGAAGLALIRLLVPQLPWGTELAAGLAVAWVVLGAPALFSAAGPSMPARTA
ncbi:MAG: phosphatase PAP2 family protein [Gemmatimonadota bacterium]